MKIINPIETKTGVPRSMRRGASWVAKAATTILSRVKDKHPSVGDVRGIGMFWAIELVRNRETRQPYVPFNAAGADAKPMAEIVAFCKQQGLWPFTHFNRMHVVPPLVITDQDMRDGLAIIDEALNVADGYYTGK